MTHSVTIDDCKSDAEGLEPIAIVGMAVRAPGAGSTEELWRNLLDGREAKTRYTLDQQRAMGVLDQDVDDPDFVSEAFVVDGYRDLDADYLGLTAREAQLADPAHRMMLEVAQTALQDAGISPTHFEGDIGVYGGAGSTGYMYHNLKANPKIWTSAGQLGAAVSNGTDYLCTNISYRLGLTGPSLSVTTACSTSLVAVHLAVESLRNFECDAAVAGGASIELPQGGGYVSEPGFTSPDGSVHPFDAAANGTVWGSGAGAVVLRRLSDALADGDTIRAVILGNAINNDGATKVGFSAPSVKGQTAVIAQALDVAGVDPATIGYVEAHGTGTALGDPIEIRSLTTVYRERLSSPCDEQWCAIGSVKANVGHMSQAAGVVALIKAAMVVQTGLIPGTVTYQKPNPAIEFESSPFYPSASTTVYREQGGPRRAAVSSFGIGGTNAHVVIEQPPVAPPRRSASEAIELNLHLSAQTSSALEVMSEQLATHLEEHPELRLVDVAHTLRFGRSNKQFRRAILAVDTVDAAQKLRQPFRATPATPSPLTMLFSGQGSQYPGMGRGLYEVSTEFRAVVDECCEALRDDLGLDLRTLLLANRDDTQAAEQLTETWLTQPALYTVEYALARYWASRGIYPTTVIGHSIGEYAAATMAGVFDPIAAARLVAARGALMHAQPPGQMAAVQLSAEDVNDLLTSDVEIAAVNGPKTTVVGGPHAAVDAFLEALPHKVSRTVLRTSHAFHTASMDSILAHFAAKVVEARPRPPQMTVLSNVTGQPLTDEQAMSGEYWASQLRSTVRFGDCVATVLVGGPTQFLEVGPGRQLASLARMQVGKGATPVSSLPGPHDDESDVQTVAQAVGQLFVQGIDVELAEPGDGRRVPLPTYPYERSEYWVQPEFDLTALAEGVLSIGELAGRVPDVRRGPSADIGDWFSSPVWHQSAPVDPVLDARPRLVLTNGPSGQRLASRLTAFSPDLRQVTADDPVPTDVPAGDLHLIDLRPLDMPDHGDGITEFLAALHLVQHLASLDRAVHVDLVSRASDQVSGGELIEPGASLLAGISRCVPAEMERMSVRRIDADGHSCPTELAVVIMAHPQGRFDEVSIRRNRLWRKQFAEFKPFGRPTRELPRKCVITGGTGGIGITVAEDLVAAGANRIALLARTPMPEESWDETLGADPNGRASRTVRAVRRMRESGAVVEVVAVDVTDERTLTETLSQISADWSGIDLVVHSAGVAGGGLAELKTDDQVMSVLGPKVLGTRALKAAVRQSQVTAVALCSSVTGPVGEVGQVDYCAGNAYLDAEANSGDWAAQVVSINWGGWSEVGMAVETGQDAGGLGTRPIVHPLLTKIGPGPGGNTVAVGRLSPVEHWVVDQHRIAGQAVLPGTGMLELARATFAAIAGTTDLVVTMTDVVFVSPLVVAPEGTEIRVHLAAPPHQVALGAVDFSIVSLVEGREVVHAQGTVGHGTAIGQRRDVRELIASAEVKDPSQSGLYRGQRRDSLVTFGPRWDVLRQHYLAADGELAELRNEHRDQTESWGLDPAMLDVATAFSERGDGTYLPLSYGEVTVTGRLPDELCSVLTYRGDDVSEVVAADLDLLDREGNVVVRISEFTLRRVDSTTAPTHSAPAPIGADLPLGGGQPSTRMSPTQAAEAFRLVLASDRGAQVAVNPVRISELIDQHRNGDDLIEPERVGATGDSDGDLVQTISKIFATVLGVPEVGPDDDFFSLGGNSLVAVQLIGQIRKAVGVRLPMRALFDCPGVTEMAQEIAFLRAAGTAPPQLVDDDASSDAALVEAVPELEQPIPLIDRSASALGANPVGGLQ